MLDHRRQRIHLSPDPSAYRAAPDPVNKVQKRRSPRLDDDEKARGLEHTLHFGNDALEIVWQHGQVMEPALDDGDIL
jgi:hypothetical protein